MFAEKITTQLGKVAGRHNFNHLQDPKGRIDGCFIFGFSITSIPDIPEGALILVVRQNNPYNPVWISHLGFVVRYSESDVRIRHATKLAGGIVKEHYLKWYFEHLRQYRRPIEGILVLMPQEQKD